MAVRAARFAHCIARRPVDYRPKSPFQPSIAAPLDLSVRVGELYTLDHELDRAVLSPSDYVALFREGVVGRGGSPGRLAEEWTDPGSRGRVRGPDPGSQSDERPLERFARNRLRLMAESSRFRPPWTLGLLQDVHTALFEGIDGSGATGELRRKPFTAVDADGDPVFDAAPPDRIAQDLDTVLDWLDRFGATYHPLIPATVLEQAVYSVRPFSVGSTAVAQTMAMLFLRYHGLPNVAMTPMTTVARSTSDLTVQLLLWTEATGSYTELVDHQLDTVLRAYAEATRRWLREPEASRRLEEVELRLLARARRERGWFSAHEATRWVGAHSDQTVLRHLNALVELGLLESLGRTRGKRFRLAPGTTETPGPGAVDTPRPASTEEPADPAPVGPRSHRSAR